MPRKFNLLCDQNYLVGSSNINPEEKTLRDFSTYRIRERLLKRGLTKEVDEGFQSITQVFLGFQSLKHSFQTSLSDFFLLGGGNRDYWKCCAGYVWL